MNARGVCKNFELMLVNYNFQEDRLEVRTHMLSGLRMHIETSTKMFHWKNTTYYLDRDVDRCNLRVIDHQNSTCSEAKMNTPISTPEFDLQFQQVQYLFGDETFLIAVFQLGFCVWCFDANVQMANEDTSYKEQRKNNIKRRLDPKRNGK